jgi:hypothetical protein
MFRIGKLLSLGGARVAFSSLRRMTHRSALSALGSGYRGARRPSRRVLQLERVEDRMVLSTLITAPAPVPATTAAVNPAPAGADILVKPLVFIDLNGSAHGRTRRVPTPPDVGPVLALEGTGTVSPLGSVHVSGTLHGTGFIKGGRAGGVITLSNARGSITLDLVGPIEPPFTGPPSATYLFHIDPSKDTGAFAHDVGFGSVKVTLVDGTFRMQFHGAPILS